MTSNFQGGGGRHRRSKIDACLKSGDLRVLGGGIEKLGENVDVIYGWTLRLKRFLWKISLTLLAILLSIAFPATSEPQLIFILLSKGKEYNR